MAEIAFRHTYKSILSPGQLDYMMDMMYSDRSLSEQMTTGGHTFLIEDGRGYVSYRFDRKSGSGVNIFHLEKIYVLPTEQKTGLGRLLFDAVVAGVKAASEGPATIELNVNRNNPAVSFYEHLGMRRDRQGDFPIGNGFYMNDYIMALDV